MQHLQGIVKNAGVVARRYKSRCWWSSEEDTRQDAIVAQLHGLRTYDDSRAFVRYGWAIAVRAASSSIKRASSPVSSPTEPDRLMGTTRAPLEAIRDHDTLDPEKLVMQKVFADRIRARVSELLGPDSVDFAIEMLIGEFQASDVAKAHGVPVAYVYQCVRRIRNVLISDQELYRMWKE